MEIRSLLRCAALVVLLVGPVLSPRLHAQAEVKLNEVLAKNDSWVYWDGSRTDWVELHNTSAQAVDLGDASLTDDPTLPRKWVFPAGASIPANGYLVVLFDDTTSASTENQAPLNTGFTIGAGGGGIYFYSRGGGAVLDSVTFGFQAGDFSLGRVPNATGTWVLNVPTAGAANEAQPLGSAAAVRINEWMADPSGGEDWFELYNPGSLPVALGGFFLTDDPAEPTLSPIPPRSFIGTEVNAYLQIWADDNPDAGPTHAAFGLGRTGDSIFLFNPMGQTVDTVTFGEQAEDISQGRMPDGTANIVPLAPGGSPEDSNYLLFPGLVVSEVLSHSDPPWEDAVEFHNQTAAAIDISGWYLSNSRNDLQRYRIPEGTIVPANGYVVFYEYQFSEDAPVGFDFSASRGDQVYLAQTDAGGNLTGARVSEEFEPAENGISFGRHETSVPGDYKFVALRRPTFGVDHPQTLAEFRSGAGAPNTGPAVGPVVINEIMYHPPELVVGVNNVADEFVELHNITPFTVPLYDPAFPTNFWRLRDAVSYRFEGTASIPPFGYALVVSFDPAANATAAEAFRAKFGVPDFVPLFGPYDGNLSNGGEPVELYQPDTPQGPQSDDPGFVPYVRVDKVNYEDAAPWPTAPDGTGQSLRRVSASAFGNDPANWGAGAPTAGQANDPALVDSDGDGLPDAWETSAGLDPADAGDAAEDADQDGHSNLFEFAAGTDPANAASVFQVESIAVEPAAPGAITFQATAGQAYLLQARAALDPASPWQTVAHVDPPAASGPVQIELPAPSGDALFYQIVAE